MSRVTKHRLAVGEEVIRSSYTQCHKLSKYCIVILFFCSINTNTTDSTVINSLLFPVASISDCLMNVFVLKPVKIHAPTNSPILISHWQKCFRGHLIAKWNSGFEFLHYSKSSSGGSHSNSPTVLHFSTCRPAVCPAQRAPLSITTKRSSLICC